MIIELHFAILKGFHIDTLLLLLYMHTDFNYRQTNHYLSPGVSMRLSSLHKLTKLAKEAEHKY